MARTDARPTAAAGGGPGRAGNVGAAPTPRPFAIRKGSALEPQRLPRHRLLLSPPFGMTIPMKTSPGLAVRRLLPSRARDDRLTTAQTGGERIGDEAIANSGVNPLALVTDGGDSGGGARQEPRARFSMAGLFSWLNLKPWRSFKPTRVRVFDQQRELRRRPQCSRRQPSS